MVVYTGFLRHSDTTHQTQEMVKLEWSQKCEEVLKTEEHFTSAAVLTLLPSTESFSIHNDASKGSSMRLNATIW